MKGDSFGRIVKVRAFATTISQDGQDLRLASGAPAISYENGYTEFSSVQKDGSPGFRILGKVTQVQSTVQFATNQVTLSIFNLGPTSRALIESKIGTRLEILAGYGDSPKRISLCDILWARTHKQGPDYITDIIAGDAHFALVNGRMNKSFSGAVTYAQVIQACIDALSDQQISAGVIIDIPDGGYNNGIVLTGSPLDELSKVCKKLGLQMTVTGNMINILPVGISTSTPPILISVENGLIGIPEVKPPGVIGVQTGTVEVSPTNDISFKTLLRSEIGLSSRVTIQSKFIKGDYVVGRVVHDFDSWSGPFYTECEAGKVVTRVG